MHFGYSYAQIGIFLISWWGYESRRPGIRLCILWGATFGEKISSQFVERELASPSGPCCFLSFRCRLKFWWTVTSETLDPDLTLSHFSSLCNVSVCVCVIVGRRCCLDVRFLVLRKLTAASASQKSPHSASDKFYTRVGWVEWGTHVVSPPAPPQI